MACKGNKRKAPGRRGAQSKGPRPRASTILRVFMGGFNRSTWNASFRANMMASQLRSGASPETPAPQMAMRGVALAAAPVAKVWPRVNVALLRCLSMLYSVA